MAGGRRSRRGVWIVNILLLAVLLAAVAGTAVVLGARSIGTAPPPRTVPVGRATVTETVTASGTVASAATSSLNFATGGTIGDVRVRAGDHVTKGETVATLDNASVGANLTAAQASLTLARRQLDAAVDARDHPAPGAPGAPRPDPQTAVDQARAQYDQANAQVVSAQGARTNLALVAPQDGTVVTLDAAPGRTVGAGATTTSTPSSGSGAASGGGSAGAASGGGAAGGASSGGGASGGASSGGGAGGGGGAGSGGASGGGAGASAAGGAAGGGSIMTIADLDDLRVTAAVPELDVGKLVVGQPASVTANALPGSPIGGSVSAIDALPQSGSAVQYGTTVGLTGPLPTGLRPGMSATVAIEVHSAPDTPYLPSVAVTPLGGPRGTQGTVRVLGPDGRVRSRTVGLGVTSDTTTQILSGLAPGELVVLPDPTTVGGFGDRRGGPSGGSGSGGSGSGGSSGSGSSSGGGSSGGGPR